MLAYQLKTIYIYIYIYRLNIICDLLYTYVFGIAKNCQEVLFDNIQSSKQQDISYKTIVCFCIGQAKSKILHWACSKELHKDHGFHCHMSIKFDGNLRLLKSKEYLMKHYGVTLHFSENHNDYITQRTNT